MSTNEIKGSHQAIITPWPCLQCSWQWVLCTALLFVCGQESGVMWPLPVRASFGAGLAWALLTVSLGMDLSLQESLLLKSLGLSVKPSPKIPIPVPSVLWRIFQKRKSSPATNRDPVDGCRVEEFNVPGNIIRVFADQGTEMLPFESCLLKASLWSGLGMAGGGQSSRQKWFLRPVLPVYGLICERVVGNDVRVQAPCFG